MSLRSLCVTVISAAFTTACGSMLPNTPAPAPKTQDKVTIHDVAKSLPCNKETDRDCKGGDFPLKPK